MRMTRATRERGQALAEFALVFPFFMLLLMSVIVLGLWVFYNQQLENAAREAARYAAVSSTGSRCPTVSRLDPILTNGGYPFRCDAPIDGWPKMTGAARSKVWGMNPGQVAVSACWSGYVDPAQNADARPDLPGNVFTECTIGGFNPRTDPNAISCPPPATTPGSTMQKADGDDKASALAFENGIAYPTTITVFTCYNWTPPLSGFLFVPSSITLRAVITEAMQRQQGK
jgi:TadE-like protein